MFDGSCATGRDLIVIKTCHVGGMDAIHNCGRPLAGDGWQELAKLRNLPAVQRPLPITVLAARHIMRTKILSRLSKLLCAAIAVASAVLPLEAAASGGGAAFLEKLSLNPQPSQILVVCHGFGCAYRNQFVLTPARVANLRAMLGAAHSAKEERRVLAKAVAWFDREGGRAAGTVGRIARAGAATKSGPSQMDCIDLTANITELLIVLDRNKLLRYHRVGEPVSRGLFVDGKQPHTTPVIVETATGTEWSVDSWTKAYGQAPDIMTISDWQSRS
jgi:hypothetical protein